MRATKVAKILSERTGIHITLTRINAYEARGILPSPPRKGSRKDYTTNDIERLYIVIILSELGIPLACIRELLLNINSAVNHVLIADRIKTLEKLIKLWRQYDGKNNLLWCMLKTD